MQTEPWDNKKMWFVNYWCNVPQEMGYFIFKIKTKLKKWWIELKIQLLWAHFIPSILSKQHLVYIYMQWHTKLNFPSINHSNLKVINISYSSPSWKAHSVPLSSSAITMCSTSYESASVPLSLMQFNVVSFALGSQLQLPWWHALKKIKHLAAACYCFITTTFEVFFFFSLTLFFVFLFLQEPWVGDKPTVAPSKDVLPCKQLPLRDKLLLFPLRGALILVHPNQSGQARTRDFSGHRDE